MNQAGQPPALETEACPPARGAVASAPAAEARVRAGAPARDHLPWLLALAALLVYAPAFWWGIPYATSAQAVHGWDVDGIGGMGVLAEVSNLLHPAPDWYTAYPVLHYLVLAALYGPYMVFLKLTGGLHAATGSYPYGLTDPVSALRVLSIIARGVTLAMAAGTIAALYLIGRELWGRLAGVLGAALALLMAPLVFYARTTNLDVPTLFWSAAAAVVAVRALRQGLTVRRALVLGALVAVAVATKDQAYGAWIFGLDYLVLVVLLRGGAQDGRRWRTVGILVASAALVYVVASGIPIWPGRFVSHVGFMLGFQGKFFNLQHANTLTVLRPATFEGTLQLLGDVAAACTVALGPVPAVAGAIGLGISWRRVPASRLLGWAGAGFILMTLLPIHHMQYRYALLPAAVLALGAGYLLAVGLERGGASRALAAIVLVVGLGWELVSAADLSYQMLFDARYAAGDWLAAHARPGDQVGYFGERHQLPHMAASVTPVELTAAAMEGIGPVVATPDSALRAGALRWVLVIPGYFSDAARERSLFLPASTYAALKDGSLGYRRVAVFATPSLIGRPLPYLPYVNPRVQVFERVGAR